MSDIERDERTCDSCARMTDDWETIDDAYICADCRAEIAAEEAEVEALRQQLRGAVQRGDWFRQAWANANGCTVEEAERAFETLGDITNSEGAVGRVAFCLDIEHDEDAKQIRDMAAVLYEQGRSASYILDAIDSYAVGAGLVTPLAEEAVDALDAALVAIRGPVSYMPSPTYTPQISAEAVKRWQAALDAARGR